jgi:hypothetical protein
MRRRRAWLVLAAMGAVLAAGGCWVDSGSGSGAGDGDDGEGAFVAETPRVEVAYRDEVLVIDGLRLTQFPNYKLSTLMPLPGGWLVRPSEQVTLSAKGEPFLMPRVGAVAFYNSDRVREDPAAEIRIAERWLGLGEAAVTGEGRLDGSAGTCHYRSRFGHMDGEAEQPQSHVGTVIMVRPERRSVGIILDGPASYPELPALTEQIARALCS